MSNYLSRTLSRVKQRYESARSFDLEDDLMFCPSLSDAELQALPDASSSSDSPDTSPQANQAQMYYSYPSRTRSPYKPQQGGQPHGPQGQFPAPIYAYGQGAGAGAAAGAKEKMEMKKNKMSIAIVDPNTGMEIKSIPQSPQKRFTNVTGNGSYRKPW